MEGDQSTRDPTDSITSMVASSGLISSKIRPELALRSMEIVTENMDDIDPEEMWFQQDGATCHTATATIDLLKSKFGDKLISRNGPVNWPPRSCDLTPLDYFPWGYVKSIVYADKLATIDSLEASIVRVIREIRSYLFLRYIYNL